MSNHHDKYIFHYSNNHHEYNVTDYTPILQFLSLDLIKIEFTKLQTNLSTIYQSHKLVQYILLDIDINDLEDIQHMFHYLNMVDLHKHEHL